MKTKNFIIKYAIYFVLLFLIVFFSFASNVFFTVDNLLNILRQVSVVGIAAVGMTAVILIGGIDLSSGAIIGLTGIVAAIQMTAGVHPLLATLIALITSVGAGLLNGFIVNKLYVAPMIATLGTMTSLRGLAFFITDGLPVYGFPESFGYIGQGYIGPVPVPVIIMILCFVVGYLVLDKFVIGRYIYGIGGNEEAVRLSGISVEKTKYFVYAFSGLLCGIAGIVLLARTNTGQPKAGTSYEMDIITAVVLGGVSIKGGEGKITGVIAGVIIMGVLANGMIIMNVGDYVQRMVQGAVLVLAVAFDMYNQRMKENMKNGKKDVINKESANAA